MDDFNMDFSDIWDAAWVSPSRHVPTTDSSVETSRGRASPSTSLTPFLPPPRPLSPMDIGAFDWDSYKSPPSGGVGLKRRRNSRAPSPPEAPPRKAPLRTDPASPADLQLVPPPPTSCDSANRPSSPQNGASRVEAVSRTGRVSTPDRAGGPDDARSDDDAAEGNRHKDSESRAATLNAKPETESAPQMRPVPPSPDVTAGATTRPSTPIDIPSLHVDPKVPMSESNPSQLPKKKLVIEYSQLRRKLSSFQDLDPPAHSADRETPAVTSTPAVREPTAGNLDSNRVRPGVTGRPGPGRWPTERVPSSKRVEETSRAPVGLPVNFYDEEWLRDIGADARRELRAQPPMELAFSESTKHLMGKHDVARGRPCSSK